MSKLLIIIRRHSKNFRKAKVNSLHKVTIEFMLSGAMDKEARATTAQFEQINLGIRACLVTKTNGGFMIF